ncbi:neuropeptide FF receptor 1-like protein [Labeo rohita]|uniref:Neuropeptide FF receptor 1-like protein n=1 Tax=Labeo rohita TaxID=84645 RepID=A0A498MSB5_LABRO|nr:neuropeptide FF receptor 1-like protein [Labeo rohita]
MLITMTGLWSCCLHMRRTGVFSCYFRHSGANNRYGAKTRLNFSVPKFRQRFQGDQSKANQDELEISRLNKMILNAVNLTSDNHKVLPFYIRSQGFIISYILSYLLILAPCMVGNGLVLLVVIRNRRMHSVTNLFILNLAVCNLLVGIVCWPFSQITCTMSNLIQGMSVSASVFTLVAIAGDRFMWIVYPLCNHLQPVAAIFTIFFIWALAFAITLPSAATMTVIHLNNTYLVHDNKMYPLCVCFMDWARAGMRRAYTLFIFVQVFLVPLCLICTMYGTIAAKLYSDLRENEVITRKRMKVIKMLLMGVIFFMVFWLPLWTLMFLMEFLDLDRQQTDFLNGYLLPIAHWLAFLNSAVNPFIYIFCNKNFRRGIRAAVGCCSCRSFVTEMGRACFALLLQSRESNVNHDVTSRRKERSFAVMPKEMGHNIQGILLEEIPQRSQRVLGAWVE